jgi:agmatinase
VTHFEPPDATVAPRYTGVRTFARLPHVQLPRDDVDAAVIGVPFDTATSFRSGARFGPEAIRAASMLLRPYHPVLDVDVFGTLSLVDGGDLNVTPGNALKTTEQIDAQLRPLMQAGIVPLVLGGDHSVVLGELRAQHAVHGPVALVLLDAHADTWDQYYGERYFHGTPVRRAVEEGLLDPARSLLAGMRGPLYGPEDMDVPRELGFEVIPGPDLVAMTPDQYGERVRAKSAMARRTCRSISTCSTRPRRRERGHPRWPAFSRARRSGSCARSPVCRSRGSTSSRLPPPTTRPVRSPPSTLPRSRTTCSRCSRWRAAVSAQRRVGESPNPAPASQGTGRWCRC